MAIVDADVDVHVDASSKAGSLLVAAGWQHRHARTKLALLVAELLASWQLRPRSPEQRELLARVRQLLRELGLDKPKAKRTR